MLGIFVLVLVGGYFAAAEIALISASRPLLRARAESGDKGARTALRLLEDPSRLLAAVQVGVTLVSLLASAIAAVSLADVLSAWFVSIGVSANWAGPLAVVLTTMAVSYVSLVFGELVPKRIGLQRAEAVATSVSQPVAVIATVAAPVIWLLARSADVIGRLVGLHKGGKPGVTEEELRLLVTEQGTLLAEEKRMITEVFGLGDTTVREVMVPRVDMVMLEDTTTFGDALKVFQRTGFSRLPVYCDDRDQIVGVLLLKDALPLLLEGKTCGLLTELARPAVFVPETKPILGLLGDMQATRNQMAIVVDEHGGTEGLVTLEDIVEEVVGEVSDEYDRERRLITRLAEDRWTVDGRLAVEEANENLGMGLDESDEYETMAGWVLAELGHIPKAGETLSAGLYDVKVVSVRNRRIARLDITKAREDGAESAGEEADQ
jgi:putative hemolysin